MAEGTADKESETSMFVCFVCQRPQKNKTSLPEVAVQGLAVMIDRTVRAVSIRANSYTWSMC